MKINSDWIFISLTIVRGPAVGNREVDTSLEDSGVTSVTVDTNPSRSSAAAAARRGGDGEGTGDSGESSLLAKR